MKWQFIDILIVSMYGLSIIILGIYVSQKKKKNNAYFIISKNTPIWVSILSIYATAFSSISFVAVTSDVFLYGWIFAIPLLGVIPLLFLVVYYFVPFIKRIKCISMYEYLEQRFNRNIRQLASFIFIIFHIFRIAIILFIPTLAIKEALPSVNPIFLLLIIALTCIIYTAWGGFELIVWMDAIQALIFISGALLVIFFGFSAVPSGINPFISLWQDQFIFPAKNFSFDPYEKTIWWMLLGGFFGSVYQYIGSQDIVQRYASTKTFHEAKKMILMQIPLFFVSIFVFVGMGSAIYLFYKFSGNRAPILYNPNAVLPYFMIYYLPAGVSAFVFVALVVSAQSTVSSSLNSVVTCIIQDFILDKYSKFNEKFQILFAQFLSLFIGIISVWFAMIFLVGQNKDTYLLFNTILGLLGGPVSGIFILGIFVSKADYRSAWVGFIVSILFSMYLSNPLDMMSIFPLYYKPKLYPFLFAPLVLLVSFGSGYISSIFIPSKNIDKIKKLTYLSLNDISDLS